jgi:uncharacterized protein
MNFIYVTDIHGSIPKYETVLKYALDQNIKLIHIGADILPKGSCIMEMQKDFVNKYLKDFYQRAKNKNINILANFGNDDLYTRKPFFRKYATLLDEVPYEKDGYTFKAYNFVPDYMFGLKTGVKLDYPGWICPEKYISTPVDFTNYGHIIIKDPVKYFKEKGTIEEDLNGIQIINKTIMAIHSPPVGINLDVCYGNRRVGSKAVYNWIKQKQPLLVLSGHIHENFEVTNNWFGYIDKTMVIQPGQFKNKTNFVVIKIIGDLVEAVIVVK